MLPVNVVFASDSRYVEHLAVAICSLFENNRVLRLEVYVINADISKSEWRNLETIARRYGRNLTDVKISDVDLEGLITAHHFTKGMFYRLFIAEKLNVSKALYLDADIVVEGSIEELYATKIDDTYLAAVIEPEFDRYADLEMYEDSKYFNSGVMLLNTELFRRDRIKDRVLDFVRRKPWAVPFPDQCGLNSVVNGRWKELHPKFNVQGYFFEAKVEACSGFFPDGEVASARNKPVIVHYTGSTKPWHFRSDHPYKKRYWKYLKMTPYNHLLPADFTLVNLLKWCVPRVVKKTIMNVFRIEEHARSTERHRPASR